MERSRSPSPPRERDHGGLRSLPANRRSTSRSPA